MSHCATVIQMLVHTHLEVASLPVMSKTRDSKFDQTRQAVIPLKLCGCWSKCKTSWKNHTINIYYDERLHIDFKSSWAPVIECTVFTSSWSWCWRFVVQWNVKCAAQKTIKGPTTALRTTWVDWNTAAFGLQWNLPGNCKNATSWIWGILSVFTGGIVPHACVCATGPHVVSRYHIEEGQIAGSFME